jgi:predicted metal-dependent HD superfamily phosphohydrolase
MFISEIQKLLNDWKISIRYVDILNRWNEPHRFYHNREHLNDLFRQIKNAFDKKEYDKLTYDKLILVALFHDIIYDPLSSNNEEASAEFFLNCSKKHCLDIMDIHQAILDTKTHYSDNQLSKIFNEFDMKIVERDYTSLLKWEEGIYNEFKSFGNNIYKCARIEFLKKMVLKYPNNSENLNQLIDFVEQRYV